MLVNIEDLIPRMTPELPGALKNAIIVELQKAARIFCEQTDAWRETVNDIDVVADQAEYSIPVVGDAFIHKILFVKIREVDSQSFDNISEMPWQSYELEEDEKIVFNEGYIPTKNITDGMQIRVVKRPSFNAFELTDAFMDRYAEGIMAHAKATLQMQPKKPYTNPGLSERNMEIFRRYRANAIRENTTRHKRASVGPSRRLGGNL